VAPSRIRLIATAVLVVAGIVLLGLAIGRPDPAARLVSASPADGDRLDGSPREVTLVFSNRVLAEQSHLSITTAAGGPVAGGPVAVRDAAMAQSVDLAADTGYRIAYHVVLADDQQLTGELVFGVDTDPPAPRTAGGHDHVDWNGQNLALLAVDFLLIAVVLVMMLRGPRIRPDRTTRWSLPDQ
jgi:methionine-rich copper-binding protein CopC